MHVLSTSLCLLLATAATAVAQDAVAEQAAEDRGRLHFQAGASHYDAGDYQDALREFERAYEISEKPELFYNFSLCYQQLGELDEAVSYLDRYLSEVEAIPNRENLQRRLENLREREEEAGGGQAGGGEAGGGQTDGQTGGGQTRPPPARSISPVAIAGFAVAGAGVVTLAVAGGLALSEKGNLDDMGCAESRACDAGSLRTRALVADIGLGLAVAGAALGVVFLFVGGNDDADVARVSPWGMPGGGGASVEGRF